MLQAVTMILLIFQVIIFFFIVSPFEVSGSRMKPLSWYHICPAINSAWIPWISTSCLPHHYLVLVLVLVFCRHLICHRHLHHLHHPVNVEAIPIYVEELLLQLTCWVECTTWEDSSSWSRAVILYKQWTLFIYNKHCDAWLWCVTVMCDCDTWRVTCNIYSREDYY